MTIDAPIDMRAAPARAPRLNGLLTAPILPTLLKLALPNSIAMFGSTLVAVAETSYIGRLGTEPLAGIALVFPFVMLTQMMSAGAMGGGVSSAISRALGAGNRERAADAGAACGDDRRLRRTVLHGHAARLRPRLLCAARRARRGARAGHALFAGAVLRRGVDLAGQHARLRRARHRRHAHALGDPDRRRRSSRSRSAARSASGCSGCRNSACAASPPGNSRPSRSGRSS